MWIMLVGKVFVLGWSTTWREGKREYSHPGWKHRSTGSRQQRSAGTDWVEPGHGAPQAPGWGGCL